MSGESKNDHVESVTPTDAETKKTKKKKGYLSRFWRAVFRIGGEDFEKRLQHISKEEAAVLARITRRAHSWRRRTRQFITLSVVSEVSFFRFIKGKTLLYHYYLISVLRKLFYIDVTFLYLVDTQRSALGVIYCVMITKILCKS